MNLVVLVAVTWLPVLEDNMNSLEEIFNMTVRIRLVVP